MPADSTEMQSPKTKMVTKILAVILSAALLFACFPISAFAATKEENTPKEEVVYVSLASDGSVKSIYVVNIFDLDKDGKIIDYGRYESVRNMTTTDGISYSSEKVTIDTKAGKLYYEGKLEGNVMPWNIEIKYYLNGTQLTGEQIAGKSGDLKIKLKITENTSYEGDFFKGYALQTSLSLNTKNCTNITATGATLANVGINKQITYTILPGKGIDTEICAKVTDFAFDGISINGIKLNLNIEIDDSKISDMIDLLTSSIKELDDGAGALKEGAMVLHNGTYMLNSGWGAVSTGMITLKDGSTQLLDGLNQIDANSDMLTEGAYTAFKGVCSAAELMINATLTQNGFAAIVLTPENYSEVLNALLEMLSEENIRVLAEEMIKNDPNMIYKRCLEMIFAEELKDLDAAAREEFLNNKLNNMGDDLKAFIMDMVMNSSILDSEIDKAIAAAAEARGSISELKVQLDGFNQLYNGIKDYTDAVGMAKDGMATLDSGIGMLHDNVGLIGEAISGINDGAKAIFDGASQLKAGTDTFVSKTSGLNDDVRNLVDTMMSAALGSKVSVGSFVSDDNENVLAVQFVIKSEAVAVAAPVAPVAEPEKPKSFWQKLLALFGIKI